MLLWSHTAAAHMNESVMSELVNKENQPLINRLIGKNILCILKIQKD